jgi:hypothetical protein
VPLWQKANLRDVPPSKRCISAQQFCSAAISSKFTGSATAVAAIVQVDCVGGKAGKEISNNIFQTYKSCSLNSEINAKWRCFWGKWERKRVIKQ